MAMASPATLVRKILALVLLLLFLLGGIMVLSPTLAEKLLFQPARGDPGPPPTLSGVAGERLSLKASDGVKIQAWWFRHPGPGEGVRESPQGPALMPPPAVLLLHGNAGDISHRTPLAEGLLREGVSVLLLEYRGYGGSDGQPSEEGFHRDALAGMDFLEGQVGGPEGIVVFGRSMGGGVAAALAAARPPGGLILESAFTSLEAMARTLYPFLPRFLFRRLKGRFDTLEKISAVQAPVFVVHGTRDEIVPFRMGEALFAQASTPKGFYEVKGAGHNDVFWVGGREYFQILARFVRQSVPGAP